MNFPGPREWLGRTVPVRVTRAGAYSLGGEAIGLDSAGVRSLALDRQRDRVQIEMTIKGLMVDPVTNMPIILLRDSEGQKVLPIWVGIYEANAIALQIENVSTPRPMTHDLLRTSSPTSRPTSERSSSPISRTTRSSRSFTST